MFGPGPKAPVGPHIMRRDREEGSNDEPSAPLVRREGGDGEGASFLFSTWVLRLLLLRSSSSTVQERQREKQLVKERASREGKKGGGAEEGEKLSVRFRSARWKGLSLSGTVQRERELGQRFVQDNSRRVGRLKRAWEEDDDTQSHTTRRSSLVGRRDDDDDDTTFSLMAW